jgi:glycosyltransferase involved in cell wall biosynthesis
MNQRPTALFLTPVPPSDTGTGSAMRAGALLRAVAATHAVTVHITDQFRFHNMEVDPWVGTTAYRVQRGPADAWADPFDLVVAFRLCTWSVARAARAPLRILDLDELDSARDAMLADLWEANGCPEETANLRRAAAIGAGIERLHLPEPDLLSVSSEIERARVARLHPDRQTALRVVPNGIVTRLPLSPSPAATPTFLFVGTLSYLPNADAVRWIATGILPALHAGLGPDVAVDVAGSGTPCLPLPAAPVSGLRIHGGVADLEPLYAAAHACLVPLRAGAGTRLKILEAMALGRPVISTALGAEGLGLAPGLHYLQAETPDEFAAACRRVIAEPDLAAALVARGLDHVRTFHSPEAIACAWSGLISPAAHWVRGMVSVVIPLHNGRATIRRTLESVIRQSGPPVEILVVDDGSGDDGAAVCAGFPDVKLIRQAGRGVASARNTGLRAARGEWLAFLDQDDEWPANRLRDDLRLLSESGPPSWTLGLTQHVLAVGAEPPAGMGPGPYERPQSSRLLGASLIHRSCFDQVGDFDAAFAVADDFDWFRRMDAAGIGPVGSGRVTLIKHWHATNLSHRADLHVRDRLLLGRKLIASRRGHPPAPPP